ncbi:MAG: DUF2019 domain-containing protein [Beijerinckiaceae bacterium]
MTRANLREQTVDDLVDRFAEICVAQRRASLRDNIQKLIALTWEMKDVYDELKERGRDAHLALTKLYDHPNIQVRLQAARLTAEVAPASARQVLEAISRSGRMPQAADAREKLRNLDEGV